jgi:hypothetical protein
MMTADAGVVMRLQYVPLSKMGPRRRWANPMSGALTAHVEKNPQMAAYGGSKVC